MSKIFTKKNIENFILSETKGYYVINKKDMTLKEDIKGDAYVTPSTTGTSSSIAKDINTTRTENPNASTYVVNPTDYNSSTVYDVPYLNIDAANTMDSEKQIRSFTTNPRLNSIINKGDANVKVHLRNGVDREYLNKLREGSVQFTKKEINEMFKK